MGIYFIPVLDRGEATAPVAGFRTMAAMGVVTAEASVLPAPPPSYYPPGSITFGGTSVGSADSRRSKEWNRLLAEAVEKPDEVEEQPKKRRPARAVPVEAKILEFPTSRSAKVGDAPKPAKAQPFPALTTIDKPRRRPRTAVSIDVRGFRTWAEHGWMACASVGVTVTLTPYATASRAGQVVALAVHNPTEEELAVLAIAA
jgi:hypothetical protein